MKSNSIKDYDPSDAKSIESHAMKLIEKKLREVISFENADRVGQTSNQVNKGVFGTILEKYYFGYQPNNSKNPDFPKAGVELKSTPLRRLKNGTLSPKERLVLNIINYRNLLGESWENSSFWEKNALLLLIFYVWEPETAAIDYLIKYAGLWNFPDADLEQIKRDWHYIKDKTLQGKAHELSEGDTLYLGACRKGHHESLIPYLEDAPPAKQRAFSLKTNYVKFIVAQMATRQERWVQETKPIFLNAEEIRKVGGIESGIKKRFSPFLGQRLPIICQQLQMVLSNGKSKYDQVTRKILGAKGKYIEEFEKADIIVRTIRLKGNGMPQEAISFPAFKIKELVEERWNESTLISDLERKFLFVVYQMPKGTKKIEDEYLVLLKVFFWNMPIYDIEEIVRPAWEQVISGFIQGNDSPLKASEGKIIHVRPHAKNSKDLDVLPNGAFTTKKSFWLNQKYLKQVIENNN